MKNSEKFFIYARKSTDVEDKQVQSIETQITELREFAERTEMAIVAEYVEKKSAKAPGRPIFNKMMERIEKGEASGILAFHPDKLARNSIDGGYIVHLLDTNKLTILKFPTFWFENTPQGRFTLSMAFVQSKYYVDALSTNVKNGLKTKVRKGEYPGRAPFGYRNNAKTRLVTLNRKQAAIVKKAFELYATGDFVLDDLRKFFAECGVRSKNGKLVGRKFVSRLLLNPFYYGHFKFSGEIHKGKHRPIISKKLFDEVQVVLNKRFRWSPSVQPVAPKPFLGLLRCASCGGAITAEIQKGHTYYRCTKKNKKIKCTEPYIREEALDAEISALLKPFQIPDNSAKELLRRVDAERSEAKKSASMIEAQKQTEIAKINEKLQRLLDGYVDGIIGRKTFVAKQAKLMSEQKTLEEQSYNLANGKNFWLEPLRNWILEANSLGKIIIGASFEDKMKKKALAKKIFGSNLLLNCKKTCGRAIYPWLFIPENPVGSQLVPKRGLEPLRPCGH